MLKRLFSICLLLCMVYPTIASVRHALTDHVERNCQDDIPNHFHSSESSCDFDQYHRDLLYQQTFAESEWFSERLLLDAPVTKSLFYPQYLTNHKKSRAPPANLM
ncbi:hypothetical protein ACT6NV_14265 [Robiginitalea sp. IMCC44478]|uniref:hypothetical protein n=1 Tax=Robiginitalea sp. IMCC44478 TaxID=3459122 RepID=UPI004043700C